MWHKTETQPHQANCIAKNIVLLQLPACECHFQFYLGTLLISTYLPWQSTFRFPVYGGYLRIGHTSAVSTLFC